MGASRASWSKVMATPPALTSRARAASVNRSAQICAAARMPCCGARRSRSEPPQPGGAACSYDAECVSGAAQMER